MDITLPETRYAIIIDIVKHLKPHSVIEIGVHRGLRARQFVEHIPHGGTYWGYDGWDDIKDHKQVYNGKGPGSYQTAKHLLSPYERTHTINLVKGWTSETLWNTPNSADFVFVDGDHRTDSIRKDFLAVADSGLICFDDVVKNGPPDAGAQPIVDDLVEQGWRVIQIPTRVPFIADGYEGLNEIAFAWQGSCPVEVQIQNWHDRVAELAK